MLRPSSVDTTERQVMEQALRDQAKFTDDLIDSLPVALAMRDHEGRYLFVNNTWEKLFGDVRALVQQLEQLLVQRVDLHAQIGQAGGRVGRGGRRCGGGHAIQAWSRSNSRMYPTSACTPAIGMAL